MALALLPFVLYVLFCFGTKEEQDKKLTKNNRAFAAKANLISALTGIPYEKLQVCSYTSKQPFVV